VKYISGYIDEVDYYEDYDESYDIIWLLNSEIYLSVYSQSITGPSYLFILALSWCFIYIRVRFMWIQERVKHFGLN
jgi:hypothetical protein